MTAPKKKAPARPAAAPTRPDIPRPSGEDIAIPKVLDLNARAAARAKAQKVGAKVKVGAVTYDLPTELRLETLRGFMGLMEGRMDALDVLLYDLFGKDALDEPTAAELDAMVLTDGKPDTKAQAARKKAYNPAFKELVLDDLGDIFELVGEHYGIDLGKSPESTDS